MKSLGDLAREAQGLPPAPKKEVKSTYNEKAAQEYWAKVKQVKKEGLDKLDARLVYSLFKKNASKELESFGRELKLDQYNKEAVRLLAVYFSKDAELMQELYPNYSINKGLLITGQCGTGKSFIVRNFQKIVSPYTRFTFGFVSTNQVVGEYNEGGEKKTYKYKKNTWAFDDLGSESIAKHYGKDDIFKAIIEDRYNLFLKDKTRTIATSNLTIKEIGERYGDRIASRLPEMFNIILLSGNDRRA